MSNKQKTTRKERVAQRKTAKRNRTLFTFTGIVGFIAILAYVTWTQVGGGNALPAATVADPWMGVAEGSIEIVEYADFGCPACRSWHAAGIRDRVLAEFGDKVRFVWKDFPVITRQSPMAAEAGHCANLQDKFWAFHDLVYEGYVGLERSALEGYAEQAGLEMEQFNLCLDERKMAAKVQANEQSARQLGLRGTPGFVVDGQVLPGPPSFEMLSSMINRALAAAN